MNNIFSALEIIDKLNCSNYYNSNNAYWFVKNPTIIFIIDNEDNISIRDLYSGDPISIEAIWALLTLEQKKILIYNLDKFK